MFIYVADAVLPHSRGPFIDNWLSRGRPFLLHGHDHAALWLMDPEPGQIAERMAVLDRFFFREI